MLVWICLPIGRKDCTHQTNTWKLFHYPFAQTPISLAFKQRLTDICADLSLYVTIMNWSPWLLPASSVWKYSTSLFDKNFPRHDWTTELALTKHRKLSEWLRNKTRVESNGLSTKVFSEPMLYGEIWMWMSMHLFTDGCEKTAWFMI